MHGFRQEDYQAARNTVDFDRPNYENYGWRTGRDRGLNMVRRIRALARTAAASPWCRVVAGYGLKWLLFQVVAGGRFELYTAYPIRVSAVPASIVATR